MLLINTLRESSIIKIVSEDYQPILSTIITFLLIIILCVPIHNAINKIIHYKNRIWDIDNNTLKKWQLSIINAHHNPKRLLVNTDFWCSSILSLIQSLHSECLIHRYVICWIVHSLDYFILPMDKCHSAINTLVGSYSS